MFISGGSLKWLLLWRQTFVLRTVEELGNSRGHYNLIFFWHFLGCQSKARKMQLAAKSVALLRGNLNYCFLSYIFLPGNKYKDY